MIPHAAERSSPEIVRMPLEDIVLKVLMLELGHPEVFLSTCIDPPAVLNIRLAISRLIDIGAVEPKPDLPLTALGYNIALLPMDVALGKMLIYSAILQCVDPVLTIVACLSGKHPFSTTLHRKDEYFKKHISSFGRIDKYSDHLAVVHAYNQWRLIRDTSGPNIAFQFCQDHFLSQSILEDISELRSLFRSNLTNAGFHVNSAVKTAQRNNSNLTTLEAQRVRCCLCAGSTIVIIFIF